MELAEIATKIYMNRVSITSCANMSTISSSSVSRSMLKLNSKITNLFKGFVGINEFKNKLIGFFFVNKFKYFEKYKCL